MNFHVGQKVVCIKTWSEDVPHGFTHGDEIGPMKGVVYTIREIFIDPCWNVPAVLLEEIVNPIHEYGWHRFEHGFAPFRFRPVQTTSIEIFRKMLAPKPEEVLQ